MEILVVEDNHRVAALIERGLEECGFKVTLVYDGLFGKKLALQKNYDLVITDIILPGISGIEFCREIRAEKPDLPIIMLTALGDTDDKVEGFNAGADDYMVKPFEMRELVVRMRSLLRRNQVKGQSNAGNYLRYAELEMNLSSKTVKREGKKIELTPKEFKLLEYIVSNPERVLSRMEISEHVWETHFDTGTNFIDVYINYIRKKIDKDFGEKLIHTRSGMGFMLKRE